MALTPQSSHFSDSAPRGDVDRSETQLAQLTGAGWAPPGPPRKDVTKAGPIGCRWHARPRVMGVVCMSHACFGSWLPTWSCLGRAELFGADLTEVRGLGTYRLCLCLGLFPEARGEGVRPGEHRCTRTMARLDGAALEGLVRYFMGLFWPGS